MKKQIRKYVEKERDKYLDAVLELTSIKNQIYELQKKFDEAQIKEQEAEWKYWLAVKKALNKK